MKHIHKLLLIFSLLFISTNSYSQLIVGPDTLCDGNLLQLNTTVTGASTYYWGFCSAYLNNIPTGSSIAAGTGLDQPTSIVMEQDGANFYTFVINSNGTRDMIKYDFGTSLANVPLATNMGNFGGAITANPKGFQLVKTGNQWYGFLVSGNNTATANLVRFDFGNSLANTPTTTSFGNFTNTLSNPQDLYIFNDGGSWYGLTNNGNTGALIRFEFGNLLTNVPTLNNLGNPGGLANPTGFWPVFDGLNWHMFVVNRFTQTLSRLDFGTSLLNPAVNNSLGNFGGILNGARDISIIRDCGNYYGYITNENTNDMVMLTFTTDVTLPPTATLLPNYAGFNGPRFLTRFLRTKDNVFAYTANRTGNSISRLEFNSCTMASIPSSTQQAPPPITYSTPGVYNVYFVADEGLPTMQVDCKLVTSLAKPLIEVNNDTLICQGDTILLVANGPHLFSALWNPVYNTIPPYDTTSIRIYPREDYRYNVHLEFTSDGACAYDTSVMVKVSKVVADAGIDQFVADGASTTLGGVRQSAGQEYSYSWSPSTFLDNPYVAHPVSTPNVTQFYYLTVTNDTTGCVAHDTVIVKTECTDITLPNAFNPVSDIAVNRKFGLLNENIVKLEYFRIFNRWGQVVFETTDPHKTWDGTYKNIELQPDNYVWIIDGYCNNGLRIKKQGTVLLVR